MLEINEILNEREIDIIKKESTLKKIISIQKLIKKESALKEICKKKLILYI